MDDTNKDLTEKIRWLLFLRVVILSFFLGATALVHFLYEQGDRAFFYSLLVPLILAYAVSIGSVFLLPHLRRVSLFAHCQVYFDVLLITGIIWITGESSSPFSFLYNLAVMNGAILLFYRGAFMAAGFSSLCYTAVLLYAWNSHAAMEARVWSMLTPGAFNVSSFFAIASLSGFLATKLNETEKLLKEKQVGYQELETLKETLLQGVGSGIAIIDKQGRINYFNRQAQHLTGLQESAVMGKKLQQIFSGWSFNFDSAQEGRRIDIEEIGFTDSQAKTKQLRLTMAPLSNSGGQLIGYVSIFEDITRQKEFEEKARLEEELRRAREFELNAQRPVIGDTEFQFEGVIGKSGGMEKICHLVQKVATGNANVLIMGESGTGKELVARAIHFNGPRRDQPFVAVNCGAIPETLIESELFGHVRGAFTGAVADRVGLFKQADQGTIFLDEVGEIPLHLQVKLLRVLQEKTFTPVGGSKAVKIDVRVISATNRDLRKEMEDGRFREDLFYRLNVVQMVMPQLRNRKDDIPILAHHFMRKFAASQNKQVEEISAGALMHLMNYSYPGNVRELENIMEHAVAITSKSVLAEDDFPAYIVRAPIADEAEMFEKTAPGGADLFFNKGLSLDAELELHEKCILLGALKRANGVQKRAATLLGINYRSLRHRLEKYNMLNSKAHDFLDDAAEG